MRNIFKLLTAFLFNEEWACYELRPGVWAYLVEDKTAHADIKIDGDKIIIMAERTGKEGSRWASPGGNSVRFRGERKIVSGGECVIGWFEFFGPAKVAQVAGYYVGLSAALMMIAISLFRMAQTGIDQKNLEVVFVCLSVPILMTIFWSWIGPGPGIADLQKTKNLVGEVLRHR